MNKRFFLLSLRNDSFSHFGLISCGILFLCGCMAGTVSAGFVSAGTTLNNYFSSFLSLFLTGASARPDLFSCVIDALKYNLIAIALGFSVLGVFFIPVLAAFRGFFLSFSVSTIVRLLGGKGVTLALAIFGVNTLITIPCFFILATYSFSASHYILRLAISKNAKASVSPFNSKFFIHCGICLSALIFSALIDFYITPHLINLAASRI